MSESRSRPDSDVEELVSRLQRRASAHDEASARVEEAGEQRLRDLREHYEELTTMMARYRDRATGDGDFEAFIEYQEKIAHFMEHLPEDIQHRDAFETVDEIMHQRRLKEADFERASDVLQPVADLIERLDERQRTRERYNEARHEVLARKRDLDDRISEYERLVELGEADLNAPVERLRDPIERYDDAVTEAFETFTGESSAREVLGFVESTAAFPLVEYRQPPDDLRTYVEEYDAGTETIGQLLDYAEYSVSKLDHYVGDAQELKRHVATHRTYLTRLDAEPLTIGWPAPPAETLRFRCKELLSVVGRFTSEEAVLAALRDVRALVDREDYDRLRESAVAKEQLDDAERERLEHGEIQRELETFRDRRARVEAVLEEYEER